MDEEQLFFCHKWFEDYTSSVHCPDAETEKNIILKLMHTYRVYENIEIVARSLGINGEDLALAKALALFHDVGRFEQLRDFCSYNDSITADHAKLGLKVINRSGVLS